MSCQRPPTPKVQLPYVEPLGCVKLNFVKVYAPEHGVVLKAHRDNGDNPELYLDLEHPRPEFKQQNGPELHLGVSANFRVEPLRNSKVKPHIDAYLAESEIHKFLQSIIQANLRRSSRRSGDGSDYGVKLLSPTSSVLEPPRPAATPQARRGEG